MRGRPRRPALSNGVRTLLALSLCALATTALAGAPAGRLDVAAAADLKFALGELLGAFRQAHPELEVAVSYGSSGNFFSQIQAGAPFDVFFSADADYPRRLIEAGLAPEGSAFQYAVGRIVIWAPASSPVQVERGAQALTAPEVRRVAIANPRHAPYGRAAQAALHQLGVYEAVKDKLVFGESVAQTAQFVQSGSVDVGLIALSLALAPELARQGRYYELPRDSYPRMEQAGLILGRARDREAAQRLRDFVLGPVGRATLKRYGFFLPGE